MDIEKVDFILLHILYNAFTYIYIKLKMKIGYKNFKSFRILFQRFVKNKL